MSDNLGATCNRDTLLENFAAELTSAAYPVALRHGIASSWIKVELGLWRALAETVKKWARKEPLAESSDEFEVWRQGFLVDLTDGAFYIAVKHGIKGSLLEVELDLYRAFRLVIRRRCRSVTALALSLKPVFAELTTWCEAHVRDGQAASTGRTSDQRYSAQ